MERLRNPEEFGRKLGIQRAHRMEVGRDPQTILPAVCIRTLVGDDPADVRPVMEAVATGQGLKEAGQGARPR